MMLLGFGPVLWPLPRTNAAWFAGLLITVLGFAVLVMLVVATKCGDQSSTEPYPVTSGTGPVTANCAPFCGPVPSTDLPG